MATKDWRTKPAEIVKSERITCRVTQEIKASLDREAKLKNVPYGEIVRQRLSE